MIGFIFTIDYEIYGNGEGSLEELVHGPAERLRALFDARSARFVVFVEAAELEMIEARATDEAIDRVKRQVRELYEAGYEIGLHIHPQWYNARYENGAWSMDYGEYNLCLQPRERIVACVDRAIGFLRKTLGSPGFVPLSFRAGNWLFQPTCPLAAVLSERGIKIDSSVFKGGVQHRHNLDYRAARKNGYFWPFSNDVNVATPRGLMMEFPTYTRMAPFWKLLSAKRVGLQGRSPGPRMARRGKLLRYRDFLRWALPLKLDFCRMTIGELKNMVDAEIRKDLRDPARYRPIVGIGHTKDLFDFATVEAFLDHLSRNDVMISGFADAYRRARASAGSNLP